MTEEVGEGMQALGTIYHLIRADFLERARRYSTLIILGITIGLTYLYLPPIDSDYVTFSMDGYRGVYNSAWVGATVTVLTVVLMSFAGFYLVKNAITRDRHTGVGQIIATTPISKAQYTISKMVSNWIFLMAMALVALLAGVSMQWIRGEVLRITFVDYLLPYTFITMPAMAFIAAVAVLFESVPVLSGGLGNAIFFILYIAAVTLGSLITFISPHNVFDPVRSLSDLVKDPTGVLIIFRSMMMAGQEQGILTARGFVLGKSSATLYGLPIGSTFPYEGISWARPILISRFLWFGIGIAIASISAVFFNRFDSTRIKIGKVQRRQRGLMKEGEAEATEIENENSPSSMPITTIESLPAAMKFSSLNGFGRTVLAEFRLMLRGNPWWWFLVAAGLIVAGLFCPLEQARETCLPLAWVWPLLSWSSLGVREMRHRTRQMIFSAPFPVGRQLPASWAAGFLLALGAGSGVILRLLIVGEWQALFALFIGATFIPSLALALGTWSGSGKLFEVTYLLLWYMGPMNGTIPLDYLGVTDQGIAQGIPLIYLGVSLLLLCIAILGRQRQLYD
jgi:hypothetical protein